jgi:hypothetical protein
MLGLEFLTSYMLVISSITARVSVNLLILKTSQTALSHLSIDMAVLHIDSIVNVSKISC